MRLQNTTHKNDAAAARSPSFTETGIVKDKWMARGGKMCLLTCIKGMEMIIVHNSADRWNPCKYWVSKKVQEGRKRGCWREVIYNEWNVFSRFPRPIPVPPEGNVSRTLMFISLSGENRWGLLLLLTPACVLIPATARQVKTPFVDQGTSHWPLTEKCAEFALRHFL